MPKALVKKGRNTVSRKSNACEHGLNLSHKIKQARAKEIDAKSGTQ